MKSVRHPAKPSVILPATPQAFRGWAISQARRSRTRADSGPSSAAGDQLIVFLLKRRYASCKRSVVCIDRS